jgi:hypothetical protein
MTIIDKKLFGERNFVMTIININENIVSDKNTTSTRGTHALDYIRIDVDAFNGQHARQISERRYLDPPFCHGFV